jgi:hypothetical protein
MACALYASDKELSSTKVTCENAVVHCCSVRLHTLLGRHLASIKCRNKTQALSALAHTDDLSLLPMDKDENIVAFDIIRSYNGTMADRLRHKKYRALGVRLFDTSILQKTISYYQDMIVLGLTVVRTCRLWQRGSWKMWLGTLTLEVCAPNSRCKVSIRFSFFGFCMWHNTSGIDCVDFMRRGKWKFYHSSSKLTDFWELFA